MKTLRDFQPSMQNDIEIFFEKCFVALGWKYEPNGRHNDIKNINEIYVKNGSFLCLFNNKTLIGTVAIHIIDEAEKIMEMKRLYILPEYQGNGLGNFLFKTAIDLTKINNCKRIRVETRDDRIEIVHFMNKYGFTRIEKYSENSFANLFFEKILNGRNE